MFLEGIKIANFFAEPRDLGLTHDIFYKYDDKLSVLIFVAIEKDYKDEFLFNNESIIKITLDANSTKHYMYENVNEAELHNYIVSKYEKMSYEEKDEFYKKIGFSYDEILMLNPEEFSKRTQIRKEFSEFVANLKNKQKLLEDKVRLEISPRFEIVQYENELKTKVVFRLYKNGRNITDYVTGDQLYEFFITNERSNDPDANINNLDDFNKKLLNIIKSFRIFRRGSYYDYFDYSLFSDFLEALKFVKENSKDYFVVFSAERASSKDVELIDCGNFDIGIDDNGLLYSKVFNELNKKKAKFIKDRNYLVTFERLGFEKFAIKYAKINTYFEYLIADFLIEHRFEKLDFLNDIVEEKLLPIAKNKVTLSEKQKEKLEAGTLKLRIYAEFNNKNELLINSKFFVNKQEIPELNVLEDSKLVSEYNEYKNFLESFKLDFKCTINDEDQIVEFLKENIEKIELKADVYLSDEIVKVQKSSRAKFRVNSILSQDWLSLSLSSESLTDEQVKEVLSKYKRRKKFIRLNDNSLIYLDKNDIEILNSLQDDFGFNEENEEVELPLYELFKVSSYKDQVDLNYDEKLLDILNNIKEFRSAVFLPHKCFDNTLRNYQIDAFKWLSILRKYKLSGILADDMGLGKTLETISFITSLKEEEPILIVSPKSLIYNWENEFKKWNPNLKVKVVSGSREERHEILSNLKWKEKIIYVTAYDSLRVDLDYYTHGEFSLVILDEAQFIKNTHAQKTKATKSLKAITRLVLTGTPIENSLSDLWSIFDFLMPRYLYSYQKFKDEFETKILDKDKLAEERLNGRIAPFILRRVKKDVLKDLPPKIEESLIVNMNDEQRALYDSYLKEARELSLKEDSKFILLSALVRLRQICVDPSMFLENYNGVSEKLENTVSLVKDAMENGHKILIFSVFTKSLEHLIKLLKKEGIKSYYICGKTPAKERLKMADDFNKKDDVKVFLISLKAGGTGLNLTGADFILHLDPWWNVAAENQASDRAHRIGQTRTVNVIKMVCKDSIEEKVLKLQEAKKDLMDKFIGEGEKGVVGLTDEDIEFLLS